MIVRSPRPAANFYVLDKRISQDRRLSWAARGVLIFLLGKPDNWVVSIANLIAETEESGKPTGRDGIYAILDELISAGYVTRVQYRDADGKLANGSYLVNEDPRQEEPEPAQPLTEKPDPAKPTLTSTDVKQELKVSRTEVAHRVITYLNVKAGRRFKHTDSVKRAVLARMKEGATEDEMKAVIDMKCAEWLGSEFAKYLTPDTLFRASKYNAYAGQLADAPAKSRFAGAK